VGPEVVLGILFGGAIVLAAVTTVLIQNVYAPRARLRARIAEVAGGAAARRSQGSHDDTARRTKQIQNKLKEIEKANKKPGLRQLIEQAGYETTVKKFYIVSAVVGLVGTAVYFLLGYPPIGAIPAFIFLTFGLPRLYLKRVAFRRQNQFTKLFADAIDVIVRGIRSGLPVGECLRIIARESPVPVGPEFALLVEGQKVGMTLPECLARNIRRMPTTDMKFFAIVLTMQQQTGGNLAETLANLSSVLRARKKMADKVKAMSAEARMTAMIIGSLPFILFGMFYLLNPESMSLLWTTEIGKFLLYGGLTWMGIGVVVMKQMVSFRI